MPPVDWAKSDARKLLLQCLKSGTIPMDMGPKDVYELYKPREEFSDISYERFPARLRSLKQQVTRKSNRAQADKEAYDHDMIIHPVSMYDSQGRPRWDGSEAQELLWADMDDGQHLTSTPKELYMSREEYQVFALSTFRGHIYQEIQTQKFIAQWKNRDEA